MKIKGLVYTDRIGETRVEFFTGEDDQEEILWEHAEYWIKTKHPELLSEWEELRNSRRQERGQRG